MSKPKKVLYLSSVGLTDSIGQSQILPYLLGLANLGYQFHVISRENAKQLPKFKEKIEQQLLSHSITWDYVVIKPGSKLNGLITSFQFRNHLKKAFNKFSIQLIHCRSYVPALYSYKAAHIRKIPFLFDMRGFWADERKDAGIWNMNKMVYRAIYNYIKKKEIDIINKSEAVVSLTHAGKQQIATWPLSKQPEVTVIPCCADFNLFNYQQFNAQDRQNGRNQLGIANDELVFVYLGSIGTWYMLPEMLLFYKQAMNKYPNSKFLLITKEDEKIIRDEAEKINIDQNKLIIKEATREKVPFYLNTADVGIFFIQDYYSKTASSPIKHGEMMGMGLPVICNSNVGDMEWLVNSTNTGCTIPINSTTNFDDVIEKIPDLLKRPKEEVHKAGKAYYSLEEGIAEYNNIYKKLISRD